MQTEIAAGPLKVTTSWDDGYPSDLRLADLLEKHGLEGTFYVPSRNSEGRPVLAPGEIAALGRRFEIGGHTRDHVVLTDLPPDVAACQIADNKRWLESLLGREVCGFAYVRGRHNRHVRTLVDKAGFRYARTIKNLTSTPGADRLRVSTTVQFFAHAPATYLRNYLRGGPALTRMKLLLPLLKETKIGQRCLRTTEACSASGGYFHLWGHSWELDQFDLWGELDSFFGRLHGLETRCLTNAAWCASLWRDTRAAAVAIEVR